jgi:cyanophycinase
MNSIRLSLLVPIFALLVLPTIAFTQDDFPYDKSIWPTDLRIGGQVIVCGTGDVPKDCQEAFYEMSGEENASIVVLRMGKVDETTSALKAAIEKDSNLFDEVTIAPEDKSLPVELNKMLDAATGVWIAGQSVGGTQEQLLLSIKAKLHSIIDDGGCVLLAGASSKFAGRRTAYPTDAGIRLADGLNLVPDGSVSDQQPSANPAAIAMEPRLVGIDIAEDTAMVLSGRKIFVIGEGEVDFRLAANDDKPHRSLSVPEASGRRVNPYRELIDLTAWRRDAIDRSLPQFPPAEPTKPFVENGSLIIVGGGGMPKGLFDEFVELAGGKDAKLVYIPCAEEDEVPVSRLVRSWKTKVASATQVHTKDRNQADTDEEFLAPLREATGIWFGGGRQWNFVDSYYGTEAHRLMLDVLSRGGVIGGSSAGASIQGEYLARANPVANFDIMAPGYERGLGFLGGVAIDQHFTQRGRQKDMTSLANTYPQLLGIGIDETTAIVVQKSEARVVGPGKVFFYDRNLPVVPGQDDYIALEKGSKFDLSKRKVIDE